MDAKQGAAFAVTVAVVVGFLIAFGVFSPPAPVIFGPVQPAANTARP